MSDGINDLTRNMGTELHDVGSELLRLESCVSELIAAAKRWRDSRSTRGRATHEDVVELEDAVDTLRVAQRRFNG